MIAKVTIQKDIAVRDITEKVLTEKAMTEMVITGSGMIGKITTATITDGLEKKLFRSTEAWRRNYLENKS